MSGSNEIPGKGLIIDPNADKEFLALGDDGRLRLSQMDFSDLYISANGEAKIAGVSDAPGQLTVASDEVIADLHDILELVLKDYERHEQTSNSFSLEYDGVMYRVTVMDDINELWFTLRKPMKAVPRISQLGPGFTPPMIRHLAFLGRHGGSGLILIAGKTGNGKTTTAYTLLREYLKYYGGPAVTIEDPPEMQFKQGDFPLGHCWQLSLKKGQTFGDRLVDSLRMSPRYIFVGELRRGADAAAALRIANSGHVVITTIHAGNVIEAVNSFVKLSSSEGTSEEFARDLFAQAITAIIHQQFEIKPSAVTGGKFKRSLKLETLFFGNDNAIRTLVREGKQSQLSSDIERQRNLMAQGLDPTTVLNKTKGTTTGKQGKV